MNNRFRGSDTQDPVGFILVGADPKKIGSQHPGGVQTLSAGIASYADARAVHYTVIDTSRSGFEKLGIARRLMLGLGRIVAAYRTSMSGRYGSAVIIAGAGLSYVERIVIAVLCRICGVKSVLLIVDGWYLDSVSKSFFWRNLSRFSLNWASVVVCIGSKWRLAFRSLGVASDKLVDFNFFLSDAIGVSAEPAVKLETQPVRFVFVGWITQEKGIREILACIEQLKDAYEFEFAFLGGGTLLGEIREWISRTELSHRITAPGWVNGEDLTRELRRSHVFVLPSHAEGFPLSLIEAFANGLPAIATDVGGVSDSLASDENGYLIEPGEKMQLKAAMESYLLQPNKIAEHGAAALATFYERHQRDQNCRALFSAMGMTETGQRQNS